MVWSVSRLGDAQVWLELKFLHQRCLYWAYYVSTGEATAKCGTFIICMLRGTFFDLGMS